MTKKTIKSKEDYFGADRRLTGWCGTISALIGALGAFIMLDIPGYVYTEGASQAWTYVGIFMGSVLSLMLVSRRLRAYCARLGSVITISDFYEKRFGDKKNIIRYLSGLVVTLGMIFFLAATLEAGAGFLEKVTGRSYNLYLLLISTALLLYTVWFGFKAVCRADMIFGLMVSGGIISLPIIVIFVEGTGSIVPNIMDSGIGVSVRDYLDVTRAGKSGISIQSLVSQLSFGIGLIGLPQILVKYMNIKSDRELIKGRRIGLIWSLLTFAFASFLGVIGRFFLYPKVLSDSEAEYVVYRIIEKMFIDEHSLTVIAVLFAGVILATVFAAADSQLITAAAALNQDLLNRLAFKEEAEKKKLAVSRLSVMLIVMMAVVLAWSRSFGFYNTISIGWSFLACFFGPVTLASLYLKRTNLYGAIAGMICGGAAVIFWECVPVVRTAGGMLTLRAGTGIYSLPICFVAGMLMVLAVSFLTKKNCDNIIEDYDAVMGMLGEEQQEN